MSLPIHRLTSSDLEVSIIPSEGGRIASIRSVPSGVEFLTQPQRESSRLFAHLDARFRDGPCAGFEECLPTVGPSGAETVGGAAPDHGDFWQLAWTVIDMDSHSLTQAALGFSRPLLFRKSSRLEANRLRLGYSVENVGAGPVSFLYASHPLFAVEPGDEIFLPSEINSLRLDYSRGERLGRKGDLVPWPESTQGIALNRVGEKTDGTAEMFYTSRLAEGVARILRAKSCQSLEVAFNVKELPYMGIWLCYGGWPDGAKDPLQYAIALEPTTSPHNTLALAQSDSTAIVLPPKQSFTFEIVLTVSSHES